jgi:ubiquinone/menaquinone biosynthesis C-methylase UbiE
LYKQARFIQISSLEFARLRFKDERMGYHTQDARYEFNGWSRRYDRDPLQNLLFKPSHRLMVQNLEPGEERILDIGCGTSRFAARVLKRFPHVEVVGLDLCTQMLRASRARFPLAQNGSQESGVRSHCSGIGREGCVHLVQGDSERLPFADNSFDLATCSHSFHHYPNQARVVAEMHRILRPGGRLMIIDGDRDRWWGRLIFDVIVVLMEGRVKHLTGQAMARLYQAAGFTDIVQFRRRGALPFLLTIGRAVKAAQIQRMAA